MTFIKFQPISELENLEGKISQIFGDSPDLSPRFNSVIEPVVDICEDKDKIYFELEVPGVKKDEINISFEKDILTIKGEKKNTTGENNSLEFVHSERRFGSFERKFRLPEGINFNTISAEYENGVLNIIVEKIKEKPLEERTIKIK